MAAAATTLQDNSLLPRPPGGNAAGAGLALVVHAGLLAALTLSVDWRTHSPDVVSAELWSAVPQTAAPRAPEPVPVPAPAPPPPAPAPPPPQVTQQRDADIAIEREQQRKKKLEEDRKKAELEAERKKAEDDKKKREQAQKDKEQKEHAAREAAEAERLAKQREENLRRMMGEAGGSTSGGSGNAARDSAPSATYAGRVAAAVRRNIVFTGAVADEATTEIEVRTGAGGTIISARMSKSSGNKEWDDAVMRAVEKTGRLPADTDGRVPSSLTLVLRPRE